MKMSNKVYDILKWVALCVLPAMGTLFCAISAIWNLNCTEQIVGTFTALDTFLGAILGLSSLKYGKENDGSDTSKKNEQ